MASLTTKAIRFCGACLLGSLAVALANILAVSVFGPAIRHMFGDPYGYSFDYTTMATYLFAVLVRGFSLAAAFLAAGASLRRLCIYSRTIFALSVANPLSMVIGLLLCALIGVGGVKDNPSYPRSYALLTLLSPLLFAPFVLLGLRLGSGYWSQPNKGDSRTRS